MQLERARSRALRPSTGLKGKFYNSLISVADTGGSDLNAKFKTISTQLQPSTPSVGAECNHKSRSADRSDVVFVDRRCEPRIIVSVPARCMGSQINATHKAISTNLHVGS